MYKFGFVAVLGKPNAGKSTLINKLVGAKVAIVSNKPQTTRDNILGILNGENYQIVFVDTPGIHKATSHLDKIMMKNVRSAKAGADVVLYLLDTSCKIDEQEIEHIQKMRNDGIQVIVAGSKSDKKRFDFDYDIIFSSLTNDKINELLKIILSKLPSYKEKNFLYDKDELTDKPVKFFVAEYIREAVLKVLKKEVPHGVAVVVTKYQEKLNIIEIDADIICEKQSHKGIIIGKGGETLKKIGSIARINCEELINKKIMLSLYVKVEDNWKDKPNKLSDLGYR